MIVHMETKTTRRNVAADTTIANAILRQLGGWHFIAMTGAKQAVVIDRGVAFSLPRRNNSKINKVVITLNGADLYDVDFLSLRTMTTRTNPPIRGFKTSTIRSFANVDCGSLRRVFTDATGLDCTL